MPSVHIRRLNSSDRALAHATFALMASVFDEPATSLSDQYVDRLLAREDFWVIAATLGDRDNTVIGGLTAHILPMTRTESSEIFLYDLAVRADDQRSGIGRRLVGALREAAAIAGIDVVFVPADNDDLHALDFYRAIGGSPSAVTFFTFDA